MKSIFLLLALFAISTSAHASVKLKNVTCTFAVYPGERADFYEVKFPEDLTTNERGEKLIQKTFDLKGFPGVTLTVSAYPGYLASSRGETVHMFVKYAGKEKPDSDIAWTLGNQQASMGFRVGEPSQWINGTCMIDGMKIPH